MLYHIMFILVFMEIKSKNYGFWLITMGSILPRGHSFVLKFEISDADHDNDGPS